MADKRNTFIQVPNDVTSSEQLKRFLLSLVEKVDVAFDNRGESPFVKVEDLDKIIEDKLKNLNLI